MNQIDPRVTTQLKQLLLSDSIHPLISDSIIEMISSFHMPYYGEFTQFINFHEAKIGTCGVNVTNKGMNFYWDRDFIEKTTRKTMKFVIIHETYHLLFDHQKRGVGYDKKIANLAADMIINSIIHGEMMIKENLSQFIEIPKDEKGNNTCIFIPSDYTGDMIFEEVYHWLMNKYNKWSNENSHKMKSAKDHEVRIDKDGNARIEPKEKQEGEKQPGDGQEGEKQPGNGQEGEGQDGEGQSEGKGKPGKGKGKPSKGKPGEGQDSEDGEGQDSEGQDGEGQDGEGQSKGQSSDKQDGKGKENTGKNEKVGKPGKNENTPEYGPNGKSYSDDKTNQVDMYPLDSFFENVENNNGQTFDVHFDDDVSEEVKKEWVKGAIEKLKARGLESADVERILQKLRKQRKDHLKEIKRSMSNDIFGNKKNKSITRPNRRGIEGLKGTRKFRNKINVLLDTSGSMGGDFEKVLSYIFQNDIEINMIQCDTEVKSYVLIKQKSELEKMKIQGLGGTALSPGLQYIANDKMLNKNNTVILTDGYCDHLDFTGVKGKVLILSTGTECPTLKNNLSNVKQIIIEKNS